MSIAAIVGMQWGDEGKAKVVDFFASDAEVVVRFQGGANAGHTVKVGEREFVFHLIPSGMIYDDTVCYLGNGVVVDPAQVLKELDDLAKQGIDATGRLKISERAHVVFPYHKTLDELREKAAGAANLGTTKRGIGPAYADKVSRVGLRMRDLTTVDFEAKLRRSLDEKNAVIQHVYGGEPLAFEPLRDQYRQLGERMSDMLCDVGLELQKADQAGKHILFEGAQGTMLDIDHGTYPYVTSSNTVGPNMFAGGGFCRPGMEGTARIVGIVKAYTTRVGTGPFPTELVDEQGEWIRDKGHEFGSTTGRPRRCGWLDAAQVRYAARLSASTEVFLTKIDVLTGLDEIKVGIGYEGVEPGGFPACLDEVDKLNVQYATFPGWQEDITGCRSYDELPANCRAYIEAIEGHLGLPIKTISVGPKRSETIVR